MLARLSTTEVEWVMCCVSPVLATLVMVDGGHGGSKEGDQGPRW
jgi:hypothetical protein